MSDQGLILSSSINYVHEWSNTQSIFFFLIDVILCWLFESERCFTSYGSLAAFWRSWNCSCFASWRCLFWLSKRSLQPRIYCLSAVLFSGCLPYCLLFHFRVQVSLFLFILELEGSVKAAVWNRWIIHEGPTCFASLFMRLGWHWQICHSALSNFILFLFSCSTKFWSSAAIVLIRLVIAIAWIEGGHSDVFVATI